jgi:hypothetical protein
MQTFFTKNISNTQRQTLSTGFAFDFYNARESLGIGAKMELKFLTPVDDVHIVFRRFHSRKDSLKKVVFPETNEISFTNKLMNQISTYK